MPIMKAQQLKVSPKRVPDQSQWATRKKPVRLSLPQPSPVSDHHDSRPPRRKMLLWACIMVIGLMLLGFLGASLVIISGSNSKETEAALANLTTLQRDWWDNEGFRSRGPKDPAAALARLFSKQRDWLQSQELSAGPPEATAAALARLEEQERVWFAHEGLAKGQPSKDPADALRRLEQINRKWLSGAKLAKAKRSADSASDSDDSVADRTRSVAELADLQVNLLEKAGTRRFLEAGGSPESERAVQLGLQWLAAQQQADGRWPIGNNVIPPGIDVGLAPIDDTTTTALALLPFLARGETHKGSEDINTYTKQVERGILYLLAKQKPNGHLATSNGGMYTHALATMALCEDLSMTNDPMLRAPCQKAVDYLLKAQNTAGGWRYHPGMQGDLSVTSWNLMALKSAQMAGLQIPRDTLERAAGFLKSLERPDHGYYYQRPEHYSAPEGHTQPIGSVMTAIGVVCRQYLQGQSTGGVATKDPRSANMMRGVDILMKNMPQIMDKPPIHHNVPRPRYINYYYWYYGTYAMLGVGGEEWKQWNPKVRDLLVSLQNQGDKDPAHKGSWDPEGAQLLEMVGRNGCTSLALLTLEVYYRHLPLNRPEMGEMAKDLDATGRKK
jgi:hypothetical protein